ncbi:hypothetical protein [Absidia glauca]|uniref:tRNA-splicing endonuclease subunit Sen2 n=1 Tax=Absidia glauca TaxID=4829 RepID=A0A168T1J2_ABSGL|nr:hypothetical protein [Absidia glauca]
MSKIKKQPKKDAIPLPISIDSGPYWYTLLKRWFSSPKRLTGIYMAYGKFVWIRQQDHGLYQQGHFGKGTLSRSEPTWWSRLAQVHQDHELTPEQITVARRKQRRQQQRNKRPQTNLSSTSNVDDESSQQDDLWTLTELAEWAQGENHECFQLDLFEAFFLVYGIDILDILDKEGNRLCIEKCWTTFSDAYSCRDPDSFAIKYVAYHYYRSQGWTPKDGLKFGVDFVLYQLGPIYRHAEFAVLVIPTHEKQQPYTWTQLLGLNRVCNQVKKTLVLCYVTPPQSNPWKLSDLDQCTVRQVIMKRWSPGSNRE